MSRSLQQAVIFDWNGTLLADTACCLSATNDALMSLGVDAVNLKTYRDYYTVPLRDMYKAFGCTDRLIEEKQDALINTFLESYGQKSLTVRVRKGAQNVLAQLKKEEKKIAILSNYTVPKIKEQAEKRKLLSYFDAILANGQSTKNPFHLQSKGDRLTAFVQAHNIKQAVIVGDSVEEIEIAQTYGYVSIAITDGTCALSRLQKARPDFLITNLNEIPAITKKVFG